MKKLIPMNAYCIATIFLSLKMKKMEYLLAANKAFLVLQELTGVLNIESALGRLSKLE